MEIKPKFSSNTIRFSAPATSIKIKKQKVLKDPQGEIPNGIYKIVAWEKIMQTISFAVSILVLIISSILLAVFAAVYKSSWPSFIIPIILGMSSTYKLFATFIETKRLNREVQKYREDIKIGLSSQPPFLIRIYRSIVSKQVSHNGISFFVIANGSVFTLMLGGLKDFSGGIFDFKKGIQALFHDPNLMTILFGLTLIFVAFFHVVMAIQRKRKMVEMDSYFGYDAIPRNDIDELKVRLNKFYRRLFLIYLMMIFIIPVLVRMLVKTLRRK